MFKEYWGNETERQVENMLEDCFLEDEEQEELNKIYESQEMLDYLKEYVADKINNDYCLWESIDENMREYIIGFMNGIKGEQHGI